MDPNCFGQPENELIGNFSNSSRNFKLTSEEISNFAGNQAAGGVMVKDMSSPGLLHSWSSSGVLDEVSPFLHQVSTDVSGYLNVPSMICGSNLSNWLNNLSNSNKLVHSSPKLGSNSVKGGVVEQKLNANISNCSYLLKRKKGSEESNNVLVYLLKYSHPGDVTQSYAIDFICTTLYDEVTRITSVIGSHSKVETIGSRARAKNGKDHNSLCDRGGQGESNQHNTNKVANEFVHLGNGSDPLAASLYAPRNDKLVPGDLSPAVPGIHPRLYQSPAWGQRTLGSEEKENVKSTMQQWYLEGVAGPLLSSGMCTKVFQFDASSSAPEAIVPVTNSRHISMELHRNRGILNRPLVSLSRPSHNISEEQIGTNGK
ncbi:hypothetical protein KY285_020548 [Solanum tuberosum]|nr:hypothetical protein KY285_020548 [Solanum tuberosum]